MLTHVLGETASLRLLLVADVFRLRSVWTQLDPFGPDPPWAAMEAAQGSACVFPASDLPLPHLLLLPPNLSGQIPATPNLCGQRTPMLPVGRQTCSFVWPSPEANASGMHMSTPPLGAWRTPSGARPSVPPPTLLASPALTAQPAALATALITEQSLQLPQCILPTHAEWGPVPWHTNAAPSLLLLPTRQGQSQGSASRRCRSQPARMARTVVSFMLPTMPCSGIQAASLQSPRGARPHHCTICRLPFVGGECRLHLTHQEPGNALWVCHVRCARERMDRAADLGVGRQYRISVLPPTWPPAPALAPVPSSAPESVDRLVGSRRIARAVPADGISTHMLYRQVQFGTGRRVSAPGRPDQLGLSPPHARELCAGDVVCTAGLDVAL